MSIKKTTRAKSTESRPSTAASAAPVGAPSTGVRQRRAPVAAAPPTDIALSEEHIRVRAYFLFVERSGGSDPVGDWLRAEQELTQAVHTR